MVAGTRHQPLFLYGDYSLEEVEFRIGDEFHRLGNAASGILYYQVTLPQFNNEEDARCYQQGCNDQHDYH